MLIVPQMSNDCPDAFVLLWRVKSTKHFNNDMTNNLCADTVVLQGILHEAGYVLIHYYFIIKKLASIN